MIEQIDRIEIYGVKIPLVKPFATSYGVVTDKEALLLKISAQGVAGWGECTAGTDPFYYYETNETAYGIIKKFLVPILVNVRDLSPAGVMKGFKQVRGHNMARAVLENALWDLTARLANVPLYDLLGGGATKIGSGISLGLEKKDDTLLKNIDGAIAKKYQRVKIKIKKGKDIAILEKVRAAFPNVPLLVDANGDYDLGDLEILQQMDGFNLEMIEQPLAFEDLNAHALLQSKLQTRICLDESIENLGDAAAAIALKSCGVMNIKQGRVGGLLKAKEILEMCVAKGMKVWSGGMLETGVGRAFNIHLQTLQGFDQPGDTSETARYFAEDIVDGLVELDAEGYIAVPKGIGLGVQVLPGKLARFTVFYERLW